MSIETEEKEVGGQKKGLTTSEYFNAYRFGEITEDTLRTELMLKGLSLLEANILINTKKKAWGIGGIEGGETA